MLQQPAQKPHASDKAHDKAERPKVPRNCRPVLDWRFWVDNPVAVIALFLGGILLATITNFPGGNPRQLWYFALGLWIVLGAIIWFVFSGIIAHMEGNGGIHANDNGKIVPSATQSAQPTDFPDASSDNQHDANSPAPAPDVRPLHEHPTPEYIAQIISEISGSSLDDITRRFIGKTVAWDGRIASKEPSPNRAWILVNSGLDDKVPMPKTFFVNVELPEHEFLLLLPDRTPIHVDGTIDSFHVRTPEIKIKAARELPNTQRSQ